VSDKLVELKEMFAVRPEPLGCGNFGCVYLATDRRDGASVAIKAIDKADMAIGQATLTGMLRSEVAVLREVGKHPGCMKMLEVLEDKRMLYIVSPFYGGGELLQRCIDRGVHSERQAAIVARQLLDIARHCHALGVAHRDIKPENILMRRPNDFVGLQEQLLEVVLVDFGVAARFTRGGKLHGRCGSVYYMAPDRADPRGTFYCVRGHEY
jgi:calcium-dependent protein kinase